MAIQLLVTLPNGKTELRDFSEETIRLLAQSGPRYQLIDTATGRAPENLVIKRQGDDLVIQVLDEERKEKDNDTKELVLESYFEQQDIALDGEGSDGQLYSYVPATASDVDALFSAEGGLYSLGAPAAGYTGTNKGLGALSDNGWAKGIGALLGLGAVAALVGNNRGSSSRSDMPDTPDTVATITVTITAGQFFDLSGLKLRAYRADGTEINGTTVINADGSYSFTTIETLSGPVLLQLSDTSAGADYYDEGSGQRTDLSTDLRAVVIAEEGQLTLEVNITPVTEIAVRRLLDGEGADNGESGTDLGAVSEDQVTENDEEVAEAFGLPTDIELARQRPAAVNSEDYAEADQGAQNYGQLLAAISGIEQGEDTTTEDDNATTTDVLNQLTEAIDDQGELSSEALEELEQGAQTSYNATPEEGVPDNQSGTENYVNQLIISKSPQVKSFKSTGAGNLVTGGELLTFALQLSEAVTLDTPDGTPTLTLAINDQEVTANYHASSSSIDQLVFTAAAPATGDGNVVSITAFDLNGATVVSTETTLALYADSAKGLSTDTLTIDNTAPEITTTTASVDENSTAVATLTVNESGHLVHHPQWCRCRPLYPNRRRPVGAQRSQGLRKQCPVLQH